MRRELEARTALEQEYNASVIAPVYSEEPGRFLGDQRLNLREFPRGRLYVPVDLVSIHRSTIDTRAWQQLAHFRHLKSLTFQECRLEAVPDLDSIEHLLVTDLQFWHTPVSLEMIHRIPHLSHLKRLTLDAAGLTGDWLRPLSESRKISSLVLNNANLTEGATESLAGMHELTWLQIPGAKIDSRFGPAVENLRNLECLVVNNTSFDDEGMQYLATLKKLHTLQIAGTAITDEGLASLGQLSNLSRVSLANTNVGDIGLRHLSQLRNLTGLDANDTRITNSSLPILARMSALRIVLVGNTAVNDAAPGFVGVLGSPWAWFPDEARARESRGDDDDDGD